MVEQNHTDDDCTVDKLTDVDYVAPENCTPAHEQDYNPDADYLVLGQSANDMNVKRALLYDGDNYATASRRDDCINQDGTLPSWAISQAGSEITVTDVDELPYDLGDMTAEEVAEEILEIEFEEQMSGAPSGMEFLRIQGSYVKLYDMTESKHLDIKFELN